MAFIVGNRPSPLTSGCRRLPDAGQVRNMCPRRGFPLYRPRPVRIVALHFRGIHKAVEAAQLLLIVFPPDFRHRAGQCLDARLATHHDLSAVDANRGEIRSLAEVLRHWLEAHGLD